MASLLVAVNVFALAPGEWVRGTDPIDNTVESEVSEKEAREEEREVFIDTKGCDAQGDVIVDLVNAERQKVDAPCLVKIDSLMVSARQKSDVMTELDCWGHHCGGTWDQHIPIESLGAIHWGENLAKGFGGDDVKTVQAWMDSPEHKETMLNPIYTHTGVGYSTGFVDGYDTEIVTNHFVYIP